MKIARNVTILVTVVIVIVATIIGKDYLFLCSVHPDFDENVFGILSLRTCIGGRVYKVKYITNDHTQDYIWVPIDDIVDISSWTKLPDDIAAVGKYEDANHLYGIHCMSDVWVTCTKKCL